MVCVLGKRVHAYMRHLLYRYLLLNTYYLLLTINAYLLCTCGGELKCEGDCGDRFLAIGGEDADDGSWSQWGFNL